MKKYILVVGLAFCAGSYATAQTTPTETPQTTSVPSTTLIATPAPAGGLASAQAAPVPAEVKGKEGATVASAASTQLPSEAAAPAQQVSAAPAAGTAPQLASEKSTTTEAVAPKSHD